METEAKVRVDEEVSLSPLTTLRIGGKARFFARIETETQLLQALDFAQERHLATYPLGGGSNLIVPDEGFAGLVLHMALSPSILKNELDGNVLVDVSAGVEWDTLVRDVCAAGLSGMECLAGIPGLVGGSPIQNIGAYGQEVAQTIDGVRAYDLQERSFVEVDSAECGFSYRSSIFNSIRRGRYLITSVRFRMARALQPNLAYADLEPLRGSDPTPLEVYRFVRDIRDRKGMLIDPARPNADARSAGSFFKNPIVPAELLQKVAQAAGVAREAVPHWPVAAGKRDGIERVKMSAAWLIERAGFGKGYAATSESAMGISSRHTLALINRTGTARCEDLLELRDVIVTRVEKKLGVRLQQEPVFLR